MKLSEEPAGSTPHPLVMRTELRKHNNLISIMITAHWARTDTDR